MVVDVRQGFKASGLGRRIWLQAAAVGMVARVPTVLATPVPPKRNRAGAVNFVAGEPQVLDGSNRRPLAVGAVVYGGQTIETGSDTEVHVFLDDGGFLAVRPKTRLQISEVKMLGDVDDSLVLTLIQGAMRSITGWVGKLDRSRYRVTAGTATIGIRGTDHEVSLVPEGQAPAGENAGVHNWVHEGGTSLHNNAGAVDIEPGRAAFMDHLGGSPQALSEIPPYLRRWTGRNEGRVARHAERIREHIEARMRKRGMLKGNERIEDVIERHGKLRDRIRDRRQKLKSDAINEGADKAPGHPGRLDTFRKERAQALHDKAPHHGKHRTQAD